MDVEKLFQGIAVIFDDEISNPTSTIYTIKENIQRKNIPVAVYNEMPRPEIIPSLSNASFVILDWDYTNSELSVEGEERLSVPTELKNEQDEELILFIRELLRCVFIPVFIFTSKSEDSIKTTLRDVGLWYDDKDNRIFIKQKNDISSEDQLFDAIEEWLKAMPSVYVLKEWEKNISKSKDAMFLELYGYSPNWVKIIWDMLKEDTVENHCEFGEFVTRHLNNRIGSYAFDEDIIGAQRDISPEELRCVVEGERYLVYDTQPKQAYTGDLFKDGSKYYLNIRAQCDLSRMNECDTYNPKLYCIKGEKLRSKDIVTDDIRMTTEETLIFDERKSFSLDEMREICKDNDVEYYLAGGSALGAVRHKGFLPWDDDVDLFITRNNYIKLKRLKKLLSDNDLLFVDGDEYDNYSNVLIRLVNPHSTMITESRMVDGTPKGTFIEFFILL